jgi:hypothetical protein
MKPHYPASVGEFEELMEQLDPLPPDRRAPIARLLFEVVAHCPRCGKGVRRCDARKLIEIDEEFWLAHLGCGRQTDPKAVTE